MAEGGQREPKGQGQGLFRLSEVGGCLKAPWVETTAKNNKVRRSQNKDYVSVGVYCVMLAEVKPRQPAVLFS